MTEFLSSLILGEHLQKLSVSKIVLILLVNHHSTDQNMFLLCLYGCIVDPIELGISLFGRDINIRDSHFALLAELRSRSRFSATIDEMINGSIDPLPLVPELTLPFSTELAFDIPVSDQIVLTPIMSVESDNLVGNDLIFDFDVDIGTFLNNDYVGENTLTSLLQNATTFLQEVASIQPELNATGTPSALDGFFDIVNQLNDFSSQLLTYISMVNEGVSKGSLFYSLSYIYILLYIYSDT